jgi:hypothetical protein
MSDSEDARHKRFVGKFKKWLIDQVESWLAVILMLLYFGFMGVWCSTMFMAGLTGSLRMRLFGRRRPRDPTV